MPVLYKHRDNLGDGCGWNENRQALKISGWYDLEWKDEFIEWDPQEYGNLTRVHIPKSQLWIPDITLYNNIDEDFERMKSNIPLIVRHTGMVTLATPTIMTSFCKMNMKYFPFDEQNCELEFGWWVYHGGQGDVRPDTSPKSEQTEFNPNGIWELKNVSVEYLQLKYNCCPQLYPKVVYRLRLKRRERFFIEVILLPCCLLCVLTMFVFLLPPESGEKMSFGVTTLLSILLFQQMIAEALPPSSDGTPIIQTYFTMLICMSSVSIVCTAFVLNLYNRGQTSHVPRWISKLLFGKIGNVLGRSKKSSAYFNRHITRMWRDNSRNTEDDIGLTDGNTYVNCISANHHAHLDEHLCDTDSVVTQIPLLSTSSPELKLILKELQSYSKEKQKEKLQNATMDDWRRVAIFVDRVLFVISSITVTIATITVIALIET
ncbi:acetylcholine receptor subunit alpha-type acr-16-like [Anneissia japonica]|uniref:acetylcholine receptor subunit alpha-type acr-16-like n=1 Tax=Anneissia japonica TaxID=1529436 RepID=UPI00142579D0|nr:acetylcholine receptor subunit alpha-type acr-16-like [Anneissia japonica]